MSAPVMIWNHGNIISRYLLYRQRMTSKNILCLQLLFNAPSKIKILVLYSRRFAFYNNCKGREIIEKQVEKMGE